MSSRSDRTKRRQPARAPSGVPACEPLERRALLALAAAGVEFRVNDQTFFSQSAPAAAADGQGDLVVVWQSLGQDGSGESIYARRYDANGTSQGVGEFFVNNYTIFDQSAPDVAADADGDFVVVWQSQGQDGSGFGIYAQRFDSAGRRRGNEFRVNGSTFGDQTAPAVAMDADGDFVVAWTSAAYDGSGLGIYARRYDATGVARGGEFRVNTFTTGNQFFPDVAADASGDFVVAWQSYGQDSPDSLGVYARRYGAAGAPLGGEFRVNAFTTNDQQFPSIASDLAGDFVVAWQSFTQDGSGAGIYARRYDAGGAALGGEFRVNTATDANQTSPAVSSDANGDFVVAWNSLDTPGSYGAYAQAYSAAGAPRGGEFRVNTFTAFNQSEPAVALDHEGDAVIAWQSDGQDGGGLGVYAQRFDESPDTAGPTVTDIVIGGDPVAPGERVAHRPPTLGVLFSEDPSFAGGATGANSALNPANYLVTRNGTPVAVTFVDTGPPIGRREMLLIFAAPLVDGNYVVTVRDAIRDPAGNALDGNADGAPGGDFSRAFTVAVPVAAGSEFRVNTTTAFNQSGAAVAVDDDGDFVVAWTSAEAAFDGPGEGEEPPPNDVYAQRFNAAGVAQGPEFRVNVTTAGNQAGADVAVDAAGNFVVTWASVHDGGGFNVYARRYGASGTPLGNEFRVNTYTTSSQASAVVAMDADGDFVVAWDSYGQDAPAGTGVYAQRYNASGVAQGGELQVNSFTTGTQRSPAVGMNASGDFVVAWESFDQDGSSIGVYARRYDRLGLRLTNEFRVNTYTTNTQTGPAIGADDEGNFLVAWTSRDQDGSIDGVYAQRYDSAGAARGGEFRVNTFTTGVQRVSSVTADADGDVVVAWSGRDQDGSEYGVFAQRYNAAGVAQGAEFRVNTFTTGTQGGPAVATDADGDFVVAWTSAPQDGSGSGIYAQRYAASTTAAPAVVTSSFLFATAPQRLRFTFDQDVSASLTLADLTIQQLPAGPTITPAGLSYDAATNTATVTFGAVLPDGRFRATLSGSGITNPAGTPIGADHVFEFTFLRGDANGDGRVNLFDFNVLAANFGRAPRDFTQGDFDYSGNVNLNDFNLLASRFGQAVGPGAGAPPAPVFARGTGISHELRDVLG